MHFNNINIAAIYRNIAQCRSNNKSFFFSVTFSRHHVFCPTDGRSYFFTCLMLLSWQPTHNYRMLSCNICLTHHGWPCEQTTTTVSTLKQLILSGPTRTNLCSDQELSIPTCPSSFQHSKKKFASLQSTNSSHDKSRGGIAKMSNCMLLSHAKCFRVGLNEVRQLLTAQIYELLQEQCITH